MTQRRPPRGVDDNQRDRPRRDELPGGGEAESHGRPSEPPGSQSAEEAGLGGYGAHGGGYGSQASYGSHGGFGSPGHEPQDGAATPGPGMTGEHHSDERIKADVRDYLVESSGIDSSAVTIAVKDGKVTLEGTVPEERMKREIETAALACSGVKAVDNKVRVRASGAGEVQPLH